MSLQNCFYQDLSNGHENVPILMKDDVSRVDFPVFQYSPENVPGPGCATDPSEVTIPGCSCLTHSCLAESCSCLQTYGQTYDSSGTLLDIRSTDATHCKPVFECNALCACSEACSNRVVQRGIRFRLEVCRTKEKGLGVWTLEPIPQGTFVCEYAGEVISFEEARRRQLIQGPEDNNYIIAVREHAGQGAITKTFMDPTMVGNVGRFLNHSCLPNLLMVPVRVHSTVPRLAMFAARDIDAQEELTFDYAGCLRHQRTVELPTQSAFALPTNTHALKRKACHCGAQNCAQFLPLDLSVINL
ncbi:histone-lysine N-methyltransferase SETMAR [Lampris incognitus]|uniref:histone-lysine N-methyltransferase SETMAR n=1 Tax=Lampris incognitus TaxID=2546036 RepID=UPI0024B4B6C2|nr:histone-lysine N-methyltransferase SETMAR [Lampris incognitus]